jgi:two-component sensor histidine kinase
MNKSGADGSALGGGISRLVMMTRWLRRRPALGVTAALALFTLGYLARLALSRLGMAAPLPFATFVPAVLVAPLLGGAMAGVVVVLLSGVAAWSFLPAQGALDGSNATSLTVYFAAGLFIVLVMHTLDVEFERLIRERRRSEQLFQELQHRIANNLQTVSTILRLQEREVATPDDARAALREAGGRLATMGSLHRRLYDPKNETVDIAVHLRSICNDVFAAAGASGIVWRVEADAAATLPAPKALALSLIVNEAIVNALKYAFPADSKGVIVVRLLEDDAGFELTVEDDGVGFPDGEDARPGGLGTKIVTSLAAQLGGEPEWRKGKGTIFALRFPK